MSYQGYTFKHGLQNAYVHMLMALLPTALNLLGGTEVMKREKAELPEYFSFGLAVFGSTRMKVVAIDKGHAHRAPGIKPDFVIEFKSTNYAYRVFSGGISLRSATAAHQFSTHGDLKFGVTLVYMFDKVLRTFFGWRPAYARA